MNLPRATRPFVEFPTILRHHGFPVSPDQTIGFIEAIGLLGPSNIQDIRRAGIAMMAIQKDRQDEYDALFNAFFLGQTVEAEMDGNDEDVSAHEATGDTEEIDVPDEDQDPGEDATALERLSRRDFTPEDPAEALKHLTRMAPRRLPRRRSYRYATGRGKLLDMRRTLREAAKRDGEVFTLSHRHRKTRQRRIVLLVDVSGSMQERTDDTMRFAHALTRAAERVEVFTLGTRLTRVTPALRIRNIDMALARVSALVSDIDGGTRIGEALTAFLSVPRYAGFARGAAVIVLSDGLERGGPEAMTEATRRLGRIAWRLDWLSPLAADPTYRPETSGMAAILPHIDALADGAQISAIVNHVLGLDRAA